MGDRWIEQKVYPYKKEWRKKSNEKGELWVCCFFLVLT